MRNLWPLFISEFIGTFFMVLFGCGAIILSELDPNFPGEFIPVIFGGVVSVMIYAVGHISGAHFNPAVTIAFWSVGRFPGNRVLGYISFQCLGALAASLVHQLIFSSIHGFGKTVVTTSIGAGFLVEILITFCLMFVIISVATDSRAVGELAGIAIGSTVAVCAFFGGPLTGASMNPARSLGPSLLSMDFSFLWVYLTATVIGAVGGAKIYEWIRCQKEEGSEDTHGCC